MKDDKLYLIHILECIERIGQYVTEGRQSFMTSTIIQDAVIRNLQVLAESSQRISKKMRSKYSEVDWRGLAGFRNILTHNYLGIDFERCWKIIESDIPKLKVEIMKMLEEE
ncbi:MAG: DUF86 domain-containing protein [candidate division Zixibacteria bacterium]|nr:DUF86 domain-containing protein [Candidatus Tariuqbacter arcticus]